MPTLARRASNSRSLARVARAGLTARGLIYMFMGILAVTVAVGRSHQETDQRGALQSVGRHSGGMLLLILMAIGFAGYALWRFSEAAYGVHYDPGTGPRVKSLARGIGYAFLAVSTVTILAGSSNGSQAGAQQSVTARVMQHGGGRLAVGVVGLVILAVGLYMVYEGVARRFLDDLRTDQMTARSRPIVSGLGVVGTIARGVVFALAGALVVDAAVTFDPSKARGIDAALRTLADQSYGKLLLALAATGLIVFGVYGLAEARWHKT